MKQLVVALDAHQSDAMTAASEEVGGLKGSAFDAAATVDARKAQGNVQSRRDQEAAPSEDNGAAAIAVGVGKEGMAGAAERGRRANDSLSCRALASRGMRQ